jgi:hypothetical protein
MSAQKLIAKWQLRFTLGALLVTVGSFQACSPKYSFIGQDAAAMKADAQGAGTTPPASTNNGDVAPGGSPTLPPLPMPSPTMPSSLPPPSASPVPAAVTAGDDDVDSKKDPSATTSPDTDQTESADNNCMDLDKVAPVDKDKVSVSSKGHVTQVLLCHVPPGNPAQAKTILVGAPGAQAHLSHHDDYLGACGTPVIPDCASKSK